MVTTWVHDLDHDRAAQMLDNRRLNAQRGNEGVNIARGLIAALRGTKRGYQNHPAVRMWMGYERAFMEYEIAMCREWRRRGFQDGCLPEYLRYWQELEGPSTLPPWYGEHQIHETHKIWLVSRVPDHYRQFWPELEPQNPEPHLEWPVNYKLEGDQ